MRIRKNIYLVVGIILIVLNLLLDLAELKRFKTITAGDAGYNVGYFIGSHILLFFGLILLRAAFKIRKRINNSKINEMIDSIGGKP